MSTELARLSFRVGKSLGLLVVSCILVLAPCSVSALAASLSGTTYDLRLLGHVQNLPTSPTVFSEEGYQASLVFDNPVFPFFNDLPNTIVPTPTLPAPGGVFNPGNTLRVTEDEVTFPGGGGRGIIWIRGPDGTPHTFNNILNPNMPVELDLTLRFDDVPAGLHVAITDVRPENGAHGFYDPLSWQFSGLGTPADPLLLEIWLDPADIQGTAQSPLATSHVKVHFDWVVIPEPATVALLGLGALAIMGLARRRMRQ